MDVLKPEDLLRWRNVGELALRTDASVLAFVEMWCEADENVNRSAIFLVPTDGSAPARRITNGAKGDRSPRWSPDGRHLAFLSARQTDWRSDLYVLDIEGGGDARLVVTLPRGIGEFAWSPDGLRFALTGRPEYPDDEHRPTEDLDERRKRYAERVVRVERLHYRGDGAGIVDDEQASVWVASLDDGDAREIVPSAYPISDPGWTPDGHVCFVSRREPEHEITWNNQVWAVSPDGGEPERLSDATGPVNGYCFTEGGSLVCTAAPVRGLPVGCHDDVLLVDGKPVDLERNVGKHVLADTIDPVSRATTPFAVGDDVYLHVSHEGSSHVWRDRDGSPQPLIEGRRVIGEVTVAGDVIAFMSTAPDEPVSIRVCTLGGSGERVVHEPNPWMRDLTPAEWREMWVDVDGVRSQAWVMLPPGWSGERPPPAVVNLHGGPHGAYGWAFNILLQLIAAGGYAVIFGNPPGSLTYGEEFTQLNHRAWGEADFPHVMAYCDEAVAQGFADPQRLGVAGGSYGGFLTLWAVGHTDRFKAAVAQRGPSELSSIFASSEFGWALMHGCFGAHPWEDPDLYRRLSPLTYAEQMNTPLRLIGCTTDQRVSMEQVEQTYIRLKVMGKVVDMVVLRDSHHLVYTGTPWNKVAHAEAVNDWFARYL